MAPTSLACELRQRGIDLVTRVQAERVGSRTVESKPDGDIIVWQRPNKPRGRTREQYRQNPESLTMRQVSVDATGKDNRAEQFKVVTTILDTSIDGGQIGGLYERRWDGEVDIRSIKSTMRMTGYAGRESAGASPRRAVAKERASGVCGSIAQDFLIGAHAHPH